MNIQLAITGVTAANSREKLIKAAYALSGQMGLGAVIKYPALAKSHKYLSKEWRNGAWFYTYPDTGGSGGGGSAAEPPLISGVTPITVNSRNYGELAKREFEKLQKKIKEGLFCSALDGRRVAGIKTRKHLKSTKGQRRGTGEVIKRVSLMPYIIPIIEKGIAEKRENEKGVSYRIYGRNERGKEVSVVLVEEEKTKLLYFSVFDNEKNVSKSIAQMGGLFPSGRFFGFPSRHSRADGLNSLDHDFILPQIWAKSIAAYPDLEVFIQNITPQNRKAKFVKAVRAVSRALKTPVEITAKHGGEPYLYPIQRELSDYWTGYYSRLLQEVYKAACNALDLPETQVETLRKALGGSGILKYRGKVIYSPETGRPLKNRDFDALIEAIQKFLNRNTKDLSKQILLDSAAIEKLLRRMAKYQSSADMARLKLDGMKYRGKTFDWIRADIRNLNQALGGTMTGAEMARYQAAKDYVGELVTRTNLKIRNEIKDTVLSGIVNRRSKGQVSQDLFNRLGGLNRDWKRIADTEMVNTANLAGIHEEVNNTPKGEKVYLQRYELAGCCDKCAKVNGKIVLWSDTPLDDEKIKDENADAAIWEGKEPNSKAGTLVPGTLHPNCRGGWTRWGGKQADAMMARVQGKIDAWDKAVKQARREWAEKGIENPNDQTKGYVDRINELYEGNQKGGA
jgi:hypothetical protein